MAFVNPYLSFNGTCEVAFNLYKSVFGGEFLNVSRYKDMPSENPAPVAEQDKILHISLPISKETILMGADTSEVLGQPVKFGDNISLSINTETEEEAKRIFEALSVDGKITMPLEKTFWGALFGMLIDKYYVHWMVSYDYKRK